MNGKAMREEEAGAQLPTVASGCFCGTRHKVGSTSINGIRSAFAKYLSFLAIPPPPPHPNQPYVCVIGGGQK